jgi:hypothetical protein
MASSVKMKIIAPLGVLFSTAFLMGVSASASLSTFGSTFGNNGSFCKDRLSESASFEDLQEKITRCQIQSVEELLPLLSEAHLSHYVLMHHSRSLQGATANAPRAILYGKDAKLIIAVTGATTGVSIGDPHKTRSNHLEILVFRDATQRFEARDVEFPKAREGVQSVQFSAANPPVCLGCHRTDPRPNWETYPLWPGAFGGEDDSVFRSEQSGKELHSQDEKAFQRFLRNGKKKGLYQFLSDLPAAALPNTEFGSLAQSLNLKRIARKLAEAPELSKYRYMLLGAVSCFYSDHFNLLEQYLSLQAQASFKFKHSDLEESTGRTNRFDFSNRVQDLRKMYSRAPEDPRVQELFENTAFQVSDSLVASLRWIVENQGIATNDWGMQLYSPSYDFENGYIGVADLRGVLGKALLVAPEDLALSLALQEKQLTDVEGTCQLLQRRSLEALAGTDISIP